MSTVRKLTGTRTPAGAPVPVKPREKPETVAQAEHWDKAASAYRRANFCDRCASQAAWGHQCGFAAVHPICDRCRGLRPPGRYDVPYARRWAAGGDDEATST